MKEFFKPFRRKAGVITLAMACMFMVGWVRGYAVQDVIRLGNGQRVVTRGQVMNTFSASSRDGLGWTREETDGEIAFLAGWQSIPTNKSNRFDPRSSFVHSDILDWKWQLLGIEIGRYHGATADRFSFCQVAYWSITIPLTLLSLWLLCPKPRKPNPMRIPESELNDGA